MSETLTTSSPLQIRAELEDLILKDLLGPAGGPEEIVAEPYVRGRYVVGLLAPKGYNLDPEEQADLAEAGKGKTENNDQGSLCVLGSFA